MKVLFIIHMYLPDHAAGAEAYVHVLAKYLLSKGHEVRVLLRPARPIEKHEEQYTFEGVDVYPATCRPDITEELLGWSTHIVSHLENILTAINFARLFKKPVFYISHNSWDYPCVHQRETPIDAKYPVGVIYNADWMEKKLNYPQRSIVLHPPVDLSKVADGDPFEREYITIINSNQRKGGEIFRRIVKRLPERRFMIVIGGYDQQIIPMASNVMVCRPSPDMVQFYTQTRLLLAPSAYESWGMAVSEAMANGIPVICSETPGLKENASYAGLFVNSPRMQRWMDMHEPPKDMTDQDEILNWIDSDSTPPFDLLNEDNSMLNNDDIDMWIEKIKALDNKEYYFRQSSLCKQRAAALDPRKELEAVEKFMEDGR